MLEPLRKYATFSGRARRKEYWLWQLLVGVIATILMWFAKPIYHPELPQLYGFENQTMAAVLGIFVLGVFLPSLAVAVRRLHDSDKSGWWLLLGLTGIGGLVLLIFYLLDGTEGPNRFGPDPKGRKPKEPKA